MLSNIVFGNSLLNWFLFFFVILFLFVLVKIIFFFIKKQEFFLTKLGVTKKLVELVEEPILFLTIIISLIIGKYFIIFDEIIYNFFNNALIILFITGIAWLLIRIIDFFLEMILVPVLLKNNNTNYNHQIIGLISKFLKTLIVFLAIVVSLENFGIDVFTIIAGLGIGGLAFAFAAQKTIADAFGGLSILVSKPFVLGNVIEFKGYTGTVEDISLRYTRIRNLDKRIVIVPNSVIASEIITNISSAPQRKVTWRLNLVYSNNSKKILLAKKIIKNAIEDCELCQKNPVVVFDGFNNYAQELLIIFYTKKNSWADMTNAKEEISLKIKKGFEKNKIVLAHPTQTIYLNKNN